MNTIANPFREVSVSNFSNLLWVLINYKLLQIIIIKLFFLTKVPQNILNSYIPIVVRVQSQKRLPNWLPIVREFVFQELLQLLQSLLNDFWLLFLVLFEFFLILFELFVLIRILLLVNQKQLWEKYFLEGVKIHASLSCRKQVILLKKLLHILLWIRNSRYHQRVQKLLLLDLTLPRKVHWRVSSLRASIYISHFLPQGLHYRLAQMMLAHTIFIKN